MLFYNLPSISRAPLLQRTNPPAEFRGGYLYVHGHRTRYNFAADQSSFEYHTLADGTLYGTVDQISDGAILYVGPNAFIYHRGRLRIFDGFLATPPSYGQFLLLPKQGRADLITSSTGYLYSHGRLLNIGTVTSADIEPDGSVEGYYTCYKDGKPYNAVEGAAPTYWQRFTWNKGRRTLGKRVENLN